MIWRKNARLALICAAGVAVAAGAMLAQDEKPVEAADHGDPTRITQAAADDIADLYAWHSADGQTLTVVLTFGGPVAPAADQAGTYDPNVLYGIHIDNTSDQAANHDIWVRFAQNDLGDWGIQVTSLPGESEALIGAVETEVAGASGRVWAGLRDDPFFFDLTGFGTTLTTGDLAFDNTRDDFAGQNVTAIVLEMPVSAAIGAGNTLDIWATSSTL